MKITEFRARAIQCQGPTVPLPPHFYTHPMDAIAPMLTKATMGTFTFHGWLLVENFTDNGLVESRPTKNPLPGFIGTMHHPWWLASPAGGLPPRPRCWPPKGK
jgi:hypothetical protein